MEPRAWFARLRALFRRAAIEREIDDELGFHLEMCERDLVAAGATAEEARVEARRRFGDLADVKERSRDERGAGWMDVAARDARHALRTLARRPLLAGAAIVTLALGVGAATTVFGVVEAVLLRPLPFPEADRLVLVADAEPSDEEGAGQTAAGDLVDWRAQALSFTGLAGTFEWSANLTGAGEPERLHTGVVTGDYFAVLGVPAALGRTLGPVDDSPGHDDAVVLSDAFWRRRFAADPTIVGRSIILGGTPAPVVGVMPPGFGLPDERVDLWRAAGFAAAQANDRRGRYLRVVGRLAPGATPASARAEMTTIAARLARAHPETNRERTATVTGLADVYARPARPALAVLAGAVGFVLLIACVNVANLLLLSGSARRRELAVRAALGASRGRLVAQLVWEGVLLAAAGGAAGVLLSLWGLPAVAALSPGGVTRLAEARLDAGVVGFAVACTLVAAIVSGVLPALSVVAAAGRGGSLRPEAFVAPPSRLRHALVVAQTALAIVLLVGGGLMMRSFLRLRGVDAGFDDRRLLTFRVWLSAARYPDNPGQIRFFRDALAAVAAVPGVRAVGAIQDLPLLANSMSFRYAVEGRPDAATRTTGWRAIAPGYFATMGIPVLGGRAFVDGDDERSPPVVIVNRTFAERAFAGGDALGARLRAGDEGEPWRTVVGVVGDVKHMGLAADEGPAIYVPLAQKPEFLRWMTFVVRGDVAPEAVAAPIRAAVHGVDPEQPVFDLATMELIRDRSIASPRFYTAVIGAFAVVALALALVGVYAVVAFWVGQRTREIGIRLALGASRGDIFRLILGTGLRLAGLGVVIGLAGALAVSHALARLLFGVSPTDAPTFAAIAAAFVVAAAAACAVPARRALRTSPLVALRVD